VSSIFSITPPDEVFSHLYQEILLLAVWQNRDSLNTRPDEFFGDLLNLRDNPDLLEMGDDLVDLVLREISAELREIETFITCF